MAVACLMTAGSFVMEAGLNSAFAVGIMRAHAFHQLPGHIAVKNSKSAAGNKSDSSGHCSIDRLTPRVLPCNIRAGH